MKYSLGATSIIESMIVLLVVVTGITGVYGLLISSQKLANSTSARIEAVQIARDGLEAFTNIRDTNWSRFAADYKNCWNVLNYQSDCIGANNTTYDIRHGANQRIILSKNADNQFRIGIQSLPTPTADYSNATYRTRFNIQKEDGFYTQAGGVLYGVNGVPYYTREIQLNYIDSSGNPVGPASSNHDTLEVIVLVQWNDTSKVEPQKLEMSTILTNWKSKK